MKSLHLVVVAFAAMGGAMSAQTYEGYPGGGIEVACSGESVRIAAIAMAVEQSNRAAMSCLDRTATTRTPETSVSAGRRRTNEPDVTPTVEIAL
jgi:hypothetical protein